MIEESKSFLTTEIMDYPTSQGRQVVQTPLHTSLLPCPSLLLLFGRMPLITSTSPLGIKLTSSTAASHTSISSHHRQRAAGSGQQCLCGLHWNKPMLPEACVFYVMVACGLAGSQLGKQSHALLCLQIRTNFFPIH